MRNNLILATMAVAALGLSACKEKTVSSATDANGTTVETTTSRDSNSVDSKTTVDPQGMMNKETVEKTHTETK